ncbi:MAG TPA: helix-turn-helix transcriptional regulator [Parafilimonas sp.]|nr:helix-turn-helix transcriptional regulator [Parafilimonas sp.]
MRFDKFIPTDKLKPFVHYFAISENTDAQTYKVLPSSGLVIGFQYKGQLHSVKDNRENALAGSGITGLQDTFRIFKNIPNTGTVLVYFTETGIAHFTTCPANEFFNQSISLDNLFDKTEVAQTEEKLANARTDLQRIRIVEQFLLSQWKERQDDKLVIEAVKLIYQSKGVIKIKELHEKLFISQSPLEKRFRKIVGTSPKKFASIVRFNTVLNNVGVEKSLTTIAYENNFFDQSHFIKDFKQYTGDTPENFRRFLS